VPPARLKKPYNKPVSLRAKLARKSNIYAASLLWIFWQDELKSPDLSGLFYLTK
jgi:hypothetical protein